jgi:hypothetical protein
MRHSPPSPRKIVSKDTSKKRPDYTCNSVDSSEDACESCGFLWWSRECNDCVATTANASTACSSDSSTNDKSGRVLCNGANETANFENGNGK